MDVNQLEWKKCAGPTTHDKVLHNEVTRDEVRDSTMR